MINGMLPGSLKKIEKIPRAIFYSIFSENIDQKTANITAKAILTLLQRLAGHWTGYTGHSVVKTGYKWVYLSWSVWVEESWS